MGEYKMKDEIQKIFKGDLLDDPDTLSLYSHDASLLEVRPELVAFPKDNEDVKNLVKWVSENSSLFPGVSITARSAGTDMSGGAIGESIILDFTKYMHGILRFDESKKEITVLPGTFFRDIEKLISEKGLMLPSYPASKDIAAIGGMVANNGGGEKTLKYGKTEKYVTEMKVVFSDGKEYKIEPLTREQLDVKMLQNDYEGNTYRLIYELLRRNREEILDAKPKVSKNSAGYYLWNIWPKARDGEEIFDLNKLFVGSQGTLGIITEITLRLVPIENKSKLVVIFLNSTQRLGDIVDDILKTDPTSLESYDDKTFKLGMKYMRDFIKMKGFLGSIKFILRFIPEMILLARGGVPSLILLAEYSGKTEEDVNKSANKVVDILKDYKLKTHITRSDEEANKYWVMRRDSFNLLRKHVQGKRTAPFIDDIIVRPEFLPEFLPELNALLGKYPELIYTIAGHAGNGNFHIIPLMDLKDPRSADIILELSDKVYDLVMKYGGSITAEHNDGIIRTPYIQKMFGQKIYGIFNEVKEIFDPKNIFNPGKKVGGTKDYIRQHINGV